MSGHSKWHSIKHKKAIIDAKRGKAFSRVVREIQIAAKIGGADPASNPRLRTAIAAAKDVNMPSKNIEFAVQKGSGQIEGNDIEELTFEGYGPGGSAFFVECSSDNRNRTTADVRHVFNKHGGNMGNDGCVAYMFESKGQLTIEADAEKEDELMMAALEAGADDVRFEDGTFTVTTEPRPDLLNDIRDALEAAGFKIEEAKVTRIPATTSDLTGKDAQQALKLYDMLENLDDVQNVYSNFDVSEEEYEEYQSKN
jgi:YebC/PmpR family DNA-binding regulatory protein